MLVRSAIIFWSLVLTATIGSPVESTEPEENEGGDSSKKEIK